jgi:membrane peptidoglycan carboxypeptidase
MVTAETYDLDQIKHLNFASTVETPDGTKIGSIGPENREYVTLKELEKYNKNLPTAVVKVEDFRFYHHIGVDFWGLGRALVRDIIKGGKAEGASTITMQVAGNVVLKDRTKTYTRKIKEIGAALGLEMKYNKQQILETYLNFVNLGNDVMGVKLAAKIYFGKDVTKQPLQPHEIALIAGLPKAPNGYNPYGDENNVQRAINRRNVVLAKMAEQTGDIPPLITQEEKVKYQHMGLGVNKQFLEKYGVSKQFEAYLNVVKNEVQERYDINPSDLDTKGYRIVVGIDPTLQKIVENVLKDKENKIFVNKDGSPMKLVDAAVTVVDPNTGLIRAIGGGRDYRKGFMNWATYKMQPGSSIKPLTVYTPAVDLHNYNEYTIVNDTPPNIPGWDPKNFDKKIHNQVPMGEAVAHSYNLATINLLKDVVGLGTAYEYATQKFKLPLDPNDRSAYAALALGGLTKGVSTIDMAQAYTAFPNNGKIVKAHTVIKVFDAAGNEITPKDDSHVIDEHGSPQEIFKPKTAWYMTRMLEKVVTEGTGKKAQLSDGRDVAGKTGTTQQEQNGWFVGYTTDLVGAVTVFDVKDDKGNKGNVQITGGGLPAEVFHAILEKYYQDTGKPVTHFQRPPGVEDPPLPFDPNKFFFTAEYNTDKQAVELKWSNLGGNARFTLQYSEDGVTWNTLIDNQNTDHYEHPVPQPDSSLLDPLFGGGGQTIKYKLTVIPDPNVPNNSYDYYKDVTIPPKTDQQPPNNQPPNNQPPNNQPPNGQPPNGQPPGDNQWKKLKDKYCQDHPNDLRCLDSGTQPPQQQPPQQQPPQQQPPQQQP